MIPRVRPALTLPELRDGLRAGRDAASRFEGVLARHFGVRHALVFPYARSALAACLRALAPGGGEVVQSAYNCVVIAHAATTAGFEPVFVDAERERPNQDAEQMLDAIGPRTAAVLAVSVFGFPFDAAALCAGIRARNPRALVIVDACLAFDAPWSGELIARQGDAALLSFGDEKPVSAFSGGALLTQREDLAEAVRRYRDAAFRQPAIGAVVRGWAHLAVALARYSEPGAALAAWLTARLSAAREYRRATHVRDRIAMPGDAEVQILPMTAAIGAAQMSRAAALIGRRRDIAAVYGRELSQVPGLRLLHWPESSAYTPYAARVSGAEARRRLLAALERRGIQGGAVWNYALPSLAIYADARGRFPNATAWAETVINLPNHPSMTDAQVARVVAAVRDASREELT